MPKKDKKIGFTKEEAKKLQELLADSAWSTSGYSQGTFAEDTETPQMIFNGEHASKLKQIQEFKNMQLDLELALRQKAIKEILSKKDEAIFAQMTSVKNQFDTLVNEKQRMLTACSALEKEVGELIAKQRTLEKKRERLIRKHDKTKKEIVKVTESISNGTIKDLEV